MIDPEPILRARLRWVKMYEHTQHAALTCRRCGISKATLRKWWLRYCEQGEEGLRSQSRRRHRLPARKVTPQQEELILTLRRTRHLGPKGLQRELLRLHQLTFSTRTIWKVLKAHGVSILKPYKRPRKLKRYTRPIPGDRIQIDTCKIGRGLIQFTAIDDCTRLRVLGLYSSRTAQDAAHFLKHRLIPEMPFPIQRIQSDRGSEFVGLDFQAALREQRIKFRPNRPLAPHLNGQVERSQRTDRREFWSTVDLKESKETLEEQLADWQHFYNEERTHSAIASKTPIQRFQEKRQVVPSLDVIHAAYNQQTEKTVRSTHRIWVPFEQLTSKEQKQLKRKHPQRYPCL
jgi:transposase InsO family protein